MSLLRGILRRLVIKQHSIRGRLQVVELTGANRPQEGGNGGSRHQESDGNRHIENTHRFPPNVRLAVERLTTVNELAGIRRAANNGLINPDTASPAANML